MKDELEKQVAAVCKELFDTEVSIELTRPEERFGDYATNIALQLAPRLGKNPREIGEALAVKLRESLAGQVKEISIVDPGFLNFKLEDRQLLADLAGQPRQKSAGREILIEFGDPNPFKAMHLGHLYSAIAGDAIARLFEVSGATVRRASYHGDVGMHAAKAVWQLRNLQRERQAKGEDISSTPAAERAGFLNQAYAAGAKEYEANTTARSEIQDVNEHIYRRDDDEINALCELGKKWSFEIFDEIFDELGIHYQKRYLESDSSATGLKFVRQNVGKVFEESDGAVVFRGEKAGLHTRVFINSRGLPTYEAKDLGLAEMKQQDFPEADESVIITAHEQTEYFKVMLAALRQIDPKIADKTRHMAHGFLSLTTGKMSSRTGKVYPAADLLTAVHEAVKRLYAESDGQTRTETYLAAVKYTFLKSRVGSDIIFDIEESVTLEGNSGPYLQYAHARARSVLRKAGSAKAEQPADLEPDERSLARKLSEYPETVDRAVDELMPHHICTYLYELAQTFNRFYEHNRVIGDPRQAQRLYLVGRYTEILKTGLGLLGIAAPEKM